MKNKFNSFSHKINLITSRCLRKGMVFASVIGAMASFTACSQYDIAGSSDMQGIDGRTLYLRQLTGDSKIGLDSCDVVHGKFKFSGSLDSVQVVMLCMDNDVLMPVVLESGKITININTQKQTCEGTPLNDTLTSFSNRYRQLAMQMGELERAQNQAYMNAENIDSVNQKLAVKHQALLQQEDKLVSSFISENFNNCLGPYIFMMATQSYEYPMLTPWIEALLSNATDMFKNNPIIKEYVEAAKHNQDVINGMIDTETSEQESALPQQTEETEVSEEQ